MLHQQLCCINNVAETLHHTVSSLSEVGCREEIGRGAELESSSNLNSEKLGMLSNAGPRSRCGSPLTVSDQSTL